MHKKPIINCIAPNKPAADWLFMVCSSYDLTSDDTTLTVFCWSFQKYQKQVIKYASRGDNNQYFFYLQRKISFPNLSHNIDSLRWMRWMRMSSRRLLNFCYDVVTYAFRCLKVMIAEDWPTVGTHKELFEIPSDVAYCDGEIRRSDHSKIVIGWITVSLKNRLQMALLENRRGSWVTRSYW